MYYYKTYIYATYHIINMGYIVSLIYDWIYHSLLPYNWIEEPNISQYLKMMSKTHEKSLS